MGVCDVPVISSVFDAVGEGAASLIAAPFDWLAQAIGAAAGWLFEAVWSVFDTTTLVDVTSPEYVAVYNILFGIAVFVMLIFFCLQLITGLIRRDPTALSRAAVGLAKSVLGSFVVITLTALLLEIVDQLCVGIIQAAGETTESMGDKIALLAAGLAIAAAAIVWLSLLVRKALLLVAIVLAPLAFSGASWDASRGWISKWAMFVIALICSKLVLVVMFLVAITQVSAPIDGDLASVADPIAGIVMIAPTPGAAMLIPTRPAASRAILSPMLSVVSPAAWMIPMQSWSTISSSNAVRVMTTKLPSTLLASPSAARDKAVGSRRMRPVMSWRQKKISITNTAMPNRML